MQRAVCINTPAFIMKTNMEVKIGWLRSDFAEWVQRRRLSIALLWREYNPSADSDKLKVDMERVQYWISNGAQPTDTVRGLLKKVEA